jgi:hypothetical protein
VKPCGSRNAYLRLTFDGQQLSAAVAANAEDILGKLAREASNNGTRFGATAAVRALVLYPMNALVNDQLGRLRLLFGDLHIAQQFIEWSGSPMTP